MKHICVKIDLQPGGFQEKHPVVERSFCIGIQMGLP